MIWNEEIRTYYVKIFDIIWFFSLTFSFSILSSATHNIRTLSSHHHNTPFPPPPYTAVSIRASVSALLAKSKGSISDMKQRWYLAAQINHCTSIHPLRCWHPNWSKSSTHMWTPRTAKPKPRLICLTPNLLAVCIDTGLQMRRASGWQYW